ncbi:MAG: magnesium transporter [Bdellovibrionales bacterium]|nr:magnesium transporter [Bdellovibrionales bacterium]
MQRLGAFSCLAIFVGLFLAATAVYYTQVVHEPTAETASVFKILALASLAGTALAHFLYRLHIIPFDKPVVRVSVGAVLGLVVFSGIFFVEHIMSTIQLSKATRDSDLFSVVKGHCGVYSGHGLIRWYKTSWNPTLQNRMEAFLFSNQCRIEHFVDLRHRQQIPCNADENSYACLERWMTIFSKRGFWNIETRKMFFEAIKQTGIKSGDDDAEKKWIQYAFKDHDLEQARPTLVQQAGIGGEFSDMNLYYKTKDEYDNLTMTKTVFDFVETQLKKEDKPSPDVLKFKDMQKEVSLQLEKLPELEENLRNIRSKVSYNPSL